MKNGHVGVLLQNAGKDVGFEIGFIETWRSRSWLQCMADFRPHCGSSLLRDRVSPKPRLVAAPDLSGRGGRS